MKRPTRSSAHLATSAAVGAAVLWGCGNTAVKLVPLPGPSIAFDRLWLGAVMFSALVIGRGGRITLRSLRVAVPGAIALSADLILFFSAIQHTTVADASVITALQPALVALIARRWFDEQASAATFAWIAIAIAGAAIAVAGSAPGTDRTVYGALLAVGALLGWTWYFIASKQARQHLTALDYQTALTIDAAAIVTPFVLLTTRSRLLPTDWQTLAWILVVIMLSTVAQLAMNWAHKFAPLILTSTVTLGIPIAAIATAATVLGERVTLIQTCGLGICLAALCSIIRRPPTERLATERAIA